jgi:mannose/fructose/N-acetylgalactosamine-specific phosphotransferase system component IIC
VTLAPLATALLGGVVALDATPVGQTMLSQPLVVATVLGALWGDWRTALEVGIVLQILAASTLPVGARTPEDYATGSVIGVGVALALAARRSFLVTHEASELLGVSVGLVAAIASMPLLRWQRRLNEGLSRWCEAEIREGREQALGVAHRAAIVLAFGVGVAYTAAFLMVGSWSLAGVSERESLRLAKAWWLAQPLWLGLGLAQVLNAFVQRRPLRGAVFGAALIVAWLVLMVGA